MSSKGLEILLVEDSWSVGEAMKDLLELLGAVVARRAATMAEAERLHGVGFHFSVSRGMIVGVAASWAAAPAAIAVDMRQATETAASIVRHAMASSACDVE
jgi:hypothetical protein